MSLVSFETIFIITFSLREKSATTFTQHLFKSKKSFNLLVLFKALTDVSFIKCQPNKTRQTFWKWNKHQLGIIRFQDVSWFNSSTWIMNSIMSSSSKLFISLFQVWNCPCPNFSQILEVRKVFPHFPLRKPTAIQVLWPDPCGRLASGLEFITRILNGTQQLVLARCGPYFLGAWCQEISNRTHWTDP